MIWLHILLLLSPCLTGLCSTDNNKVIRDYFSYRNVHQIVGFSCDDIESNIHLSRTFNNDYKYTSLWGPLSTRLRSEFRQLLSTKYHRLGIFIDTRCDNQTSSRILFQATKYFMYDEMHKWFLLGSNLHESLQMLNDGAFNILTDIVIAIPVGNGYNLYDVYNPCKARGGALNVTIYGTWNSKTGLNVTLTHSKLMRRSNLHGMKLKVGVVISYRSGNMSFSDIMLSNNMNTRYSRMKFLYTLLLHMADLFNFTIETVEISTQRKFDNSGPVFTAFRKKLIDISASPVAMKIDHLNYGDMIGPVWPIRSCFMFRTISSTKFQATQFLKPLTAKVWYVILGTIGIAVLVLFILLRLEDIHNSSESYGVSILITIGAMTQQGSTFVPSHFSGRIAFLHILFLSVLIFNYYSASVVSDRLKNIGKKMNDSLISLADSNLEIAVEPTPYIQSFLQIPDREVRYFYQKRWIKLPESERYLPLDEGLNRVAKGTLAYHTMTDSAYPYIERFFQDRSICELTEVHVLRTVLAFYARHHSPFTELMRVGLTKLIDVGIHHRELSRWSTRKPFCPNNLLIAEPLSIHEAVPVFFFLFICISLSILVCLMENLICWLWKSHYSKRL